MFSGVSHAIIDGGGFLKQFKQNFKVVVRACYGAYFVAHVLKYLPPNFVSGRPG